MPSIEIDIVSDVVCPWCLIGTRRLEAALEAFPELDAQVTFHPFLLDPSAPQEGAELRDHLRKKYGDPEPMFRRVEAVAKESGIALDFNKVRRIVSTVRAHTLLRHAARLRNAEARGTQRALANALFLAYFTEGRDISAMDVVIDLGEQHGFTKDTVIALLEDPAELNATRENAKRAAEGGVTGVPFVIIGKRVGISGAQSADVFREAIAKSLASAAGPTG
jgi:predicted DsbA family dithiol-disulfide isomerase